MKKDVMKIEPKLLREANDHYWGRVEDGVKKVSVAIVDNKIVDIFYHIQSHKQFESYESFCMKNGWKPTINKAKNKEAYDNARYQDWLNILPQKKEDFIRKNSTAIIKDGFINHYTRATYDGASISRGEFSEKNVFAGYPIFEDMV